MSCVQWCYCRCVIFSMHVRVCVSILIWSVCMFVSGFVLILTVGLLTAAVYDGLSCCLSPLSRLCLLCSDVQTSTASRNRDFLSLFLSLVF